MAQKQIASTPSALVAAKDGATGEKQNLADYERRLHDLEGRLAQNALERRVLREDKDVLTAQLGELRAKYRELFDNELSLRTELLACEQEKLALSKAFVAFQLERDTQVQQLDSDKFEVETRLLKAEQLVVEIQQDDTTKAAQIQDLCAKMNELVADKTRLGGELTLLQKAVRAAESALNAEAKKNQQLSLELIVAVNQKQKCQGEMEALAAQLRSRQAQVDAQLKECTQLRSDNEALRQSAAEYDEKLEAMRKDVVRRELELERAELAVKKEQLETQQAGRDADSKHERSVKQLSDELVTQRAAFAADKRSLELQLERVQHDLARETRDKQQAMASLKAKHEENEELLLALERARHDAHAQLETFRLKLALLQQSSNNVEGAGESASGAGLQALRELLVSYQMRERELRDELSSARSASVQQQVASEMKQRTEQALALAELEARNVALPQTSSNNPSDASELESLRAAKAQLESRLSSSKAQWMALLEQVERRCAELFTKNVMLTEDNENLRQHLTKARMKAPR
ncbi:hypothetical protein PHYSODRAFT_492954 [Phytophthora sojae]|uniref:DUF4472 domain-containing protein n=1 Tax=Phytophthora sojae (strain P6497) TaxID=1094619 RepID=G4ZA72_PHYSP|nr:hypothetical protein PHYSODRAFT_492954 [Phytophthora sojae]EGZ21957.1 hypothetical protein PHYSODRAFT_492954 [Phytophthora sojae]|eukprot:XP_009524674.1 hypothetical protein PHYSODRAFT_492954 [Phytophthora sojae]